VSALEIRLQPVLPFRVITPYPLCLVEVVRAGHTMTLRRVVTALTLDNLMADPTDEIDTETLVTFLVGMPTDHGSC